MEENKEKDAQIEEKFLAKLAELLEIAKKKKNVIESYKFSSNYIFKRLILNIISLRIL